MDDKQKILFERVYEMYNKFGIKSITMDDVSRELGISKKTLYQYVKDKSELVEQVMLRNTSKHRKAMYDIVDKNLNAIVELLEINACMNQMVKDHNPTLNYDLNKYYPEISRKLKQETRKRMFESIKRNLIKGQEEGIYRIDMDVDIVSRIHMTRIENEHSSDAFTLNELNSPNVLREIFIYHLHGISNEKGIQVLKEKLKQYINAE